MVGVARAAACVKHKPHAADMQARACECSGLPCAGLASQAHAQAAQCSDKHHQNTTERTESLHEIAVCTAR